MLSGGDLTDILRRHAELDALHGGDSAGDSISGWQVENPWAGFLTSKILRELREQGVLVQQAGAEYLNTPKSAPAFDRIDVWLYVAFPGMPKLEVPAFSKSKVPTRVFEMRDYESHSELKALNADAVVGTIDLPMKKARPDGLSSNDEAPSA